MAHRKVAIIATKGNLDEAYPPLNIAVTAAALDAEVAIFFTFEGLNIIHRQASRDLPVAAGKEPLRQALQIANVPTVPTLVDMCRDLGVKLIGCQMTMDVMGVKTEDLVDGVEVGGATTFLNFAFDADVTTTF